MGMHLLQKQDSQAGLRPSAFGCLIEFLASILLFDSNSTAILFLSKIMLAKFLCPPILTRSVGANSFALTLNPTN